MLSIVLLCVVLLKGVLMADKPTPQSHAVVEVPGIGKVAIPHGTPLSVVHEAIMNHPEYKQPEAPIIPDSVELRDTISAPVSTPIPEITAAGAIENSPQFREAARQAWQATGDGWDKKEAGFDISREGRIFGRTEQDADGGTYDHLQQPNTDDTLALFHVHPNSVLPEPSGPDIAVAKQIGKPVMVASSDGLFEISGTGEVTKIFSGADWMKAPKAPKKN